MRPILITFLFFLLSPLVAYAAPSSYSNYVQSPPATQLTGSNSKLSFPFGNGSNPQELTQQLSCDDVNGYVSSIKNINTETFAISANSSKTTSVYVVLDGVQSDNTIVVDSVTPSASSTFTFSTPVLIDCVGTFDIVYHGVVVNSLSYSWLNFDGSNLLPVTVFFDSIEPPPIEPIPPPPFSTYDNARLASTTCTLLASDTICTYTYSTTSDAYKDSTTLFYGILLFVIGMFIISFI